MVLVRLIAVGQVQGVGFRRRVQNEATALGLRGIVRNASDGSVEAVAEGDEAKINALAKNLSGKPGMLGGGCERVHVFFEGENGFQKPWKEYKGFEVDWR